MKILIAGMLAGMLLGIPFASAQADGRQEPIRFAEGASGATIAGKIKGRQSIDYRVRASAGQSMAAIFKSSNRSAYFNVLPPASDTALFVGSTSGDRFEAELPADGEYTIRVYLMRNAARRNETASYTLKVGMSGKTAAPAPAPPATSAAGAAFDQTLELQGIRFHVTSANAGSINTLRIAPAGLATDNSTIERTIDGTVTAAEVADLNVDGSPEIYVYVTSAGSGSYGSLVAYAANRRQSLSEIPLPPITDDKEATKGYMGHDAFAVVENVLVRRFPIFLDNDTNAHPTGGTRQLQYKLVAGEAGWLLKADQLVEY